MDNLDIHNLNAPRRYRIIDTGDSSRRYGNCGVCGKYADSVYIQQEEKEFQIQYPKTGKIPRIL